MNRGNEGDGVDRMEANEEIELAEDVRGDKYHSLDATCRDGGRFVAQQSEAERFWSHVQFSSDCWRWRLRLNKFKYGRHRNAAGIMVLAHRAAYELVVGPIPPGLTLDHLCENPDCVRPSHLEPVTYAENTRRRWARQRARLA